MFYKYVFMIMDYGIKTLIIYIIKKGTQYNFKLSYEDSDASQLLI